MASMIRVGLLCVLMAGLAACGGAPPARPPVAVERANSADREARRALRDGDLAVARNLFEQSLRLQQSLDNLPGVATAAINLAVVYHDMKNDDMALRLLNTIMADTLTPYPAELRSAAAFRKAVILVDAGYKDASPAVDSAAQLCTRSCEFTAGIHNLRARIALAQKEYALAASFAKQAADAAGDGKEELANARRYSARAQAFLGQPNLALEHYLAALELDKQLGVGGRIAEDLDGASNALAQLGRKDEATAYARRAAAARDALQFKPGNAPAQ